MDLVASNERLQVVKEAIRSSGFLQTIKDSFVGRSMSVLWTTIVVLPLEDIYFRGVWRNQPNEDICAQISGHESSFWRQHPEDCNLLIYKHFDSWSVWLEYTILTLVVVSLARHAVRCCKNIVMNKTKKKECPPPG